MHGETQEVKDEVVRLAKKHGIITPYTSFLILEDEAIASNNPRVRPTDQILRPRALEAPMIREELELDDVQSTIVTRDRNEMKKSGGSGVRASKEIQSLNKADNISASEQGIERLAYKDNKGTARNLSDGITNVQGRALYNNNGTWLDANVALDAKNIDNQKANRVKFNSEEYFKLMSRDGANEFLALGRNVRFMLKDELIEIYE